MYEIEWKPSALRELDKLDRGIYSRIFKKVEDLKKEINLRDVKRLQGSNNFRLRVGDYRIILSLEGNLISVLKIGHRKNIYKR